MKTLRQAADHSGLNTPVLNVQKLRVTRKLPIPLSMLRLINDLDPDSIMFHTGDISAGAVGCNADLGLLSNGFWSLQGKLHEGSKLTGSNYALGIVLRHKDSAGRTMGFRQTGHLNHGQDDTFQQNGRSSWIEDNWAGLRSHQGWAWKLHSDPSASAVEVLEVVLEGLGIAVVAVIVVLWGHAEANDKCQWATDEQGSVLRQCDET